MICQNPRLSNGTRPALKLDALREPEQTRINELRLAWILAVEGT